MKTNNPYHEHIYLPASLELEERFHDVWGDYGIDNAYRTCKEEIEGLALHYVGLCWSYMPEQSPAATPYAQQQIWKKLCADLNEDLEELVQEAKEA